MLMHLLVYKSAKNNSMVGNIKGSLYVALEGTPKVFFQGALKVEGNVKKKIHIYTHKFS